MPSKKIPQPSAAGGPPSIKREQEVEMPGEGKIKLNVTVRTSAGTAHKNAAVNVVDGVDQPVERTKHTDEYGKCSFDVSLGQYTVSTNAFGETKSRRIRVEADDSCIDVKFEVGDGQLTAALIDLSMHSNFVQAGETITVKADHYPDTDCDYTWEVAGASVLEQEDEQNAGEIHLAVPTTGSNEVDITTTITHRPTASSITLKKIYKVVPSSSRMGPENYKGMTGKMELTTPLPVSLQRSTPPSTDDQALWVAIRNRAKAIAFSGSGYKDFIDRVLCHGEIDRDSNAETGAMLTRKYYGPGAALHGVAAYELLKTATQAFLLLQCGLVIELNDRFTGERLYKPSEEASRLGAPVPITEIQQKLVSYLGGDKLPYIKRIVDATLVELNGTDSPFCNGYLNGRINPCMMELIWSYWQEEGMLVQSINAISLRFQNRRGPLENDPLGHFETSPLRTMNNLVWGYIQDEQHRLTVLRRAHEYDHHYGLSLYGKAVGDLRTVDSRSKFLEAFHNLLYLLTVFYKQADDTTIVPDAFPVLNALREVHLELAQGAHNQFGDLPWTARAEMLMQQWLLARPEMREFLQSRPMVPYKEPWMAQVDTMKKLQGWTDCSVSTFHDLAVYGEQILLSMRYGDWVGVTDPAQAANWARYWRPEVQGYIHAYRTATGVDLTASVTDSQQAALRTTQPSVLLRQRLQGSSLTALPAPTTPALSASFRERRALRRIT